jgi:hypothetical protein
MRRIYVGAPQVGEIAAAGKPFVLIKQPRQLPALSETGRSAGAILLQTSALETLQVAASTELAVGAGN